MVLAHGLAHFSYLWQCLSLYFYQQFVSIRYSFRVLCIRKQDSATVLFIFVWNVVAFVLIPLCMLWFCVVLQENRSIYWIVQCIHEDLYATIDYFERIPEQKETQKKTHIPARSNVVEKRRKEKEREKLVPSMLLFLYIIIVIIAI